MSFFYEKRDYNYEAFLVDMDFVPHMHEKIEIMYVKASSIQKLETVRK